MRNWTLLPLVVEIVSGCAGRMGGELGADDGTPPAFRNVPLGSVILTTFDTRSPLTKAITR
jgi:hypothetical protein